MVVLVVQAQILPLVQVGRQVGRQAARLLLQAERQAVRLLLQVERQAARLLVQVGRQAARLLVQVGRQAARLLVQVGRQAALPLLKELVQEGRRQRAEGKEACTHILHLATGSRGTIQTKPAYRACAARSAPRRFQALGFWLVRGGGLGLCSCDF
jgi:hypothetical protein